MTDRTCSVDDCEKPRGGYSSGWCPMHYQRWMRNGNLDDPKPRRIRSCSIDGCGKPAQARGWCPMHYQRWRQTGSTDDPKPLTPDGLCVVDGCMKPCRGLGWCGTHYSRWLRHGTIEYTRPSDFAPDGTKWCPKCQAYKSTDQFSSSSRSPSGLRSWCKICSFEAESASPTYSARRLAARRRRRARERGGRSESYFSSEIADRDGWICQICRKRIGKSYKWPHSRSLSIDHIIPVSRGGDDVKANVQAAHLRCNMSKHDRGTDQLRLIG